MKKIKSVAMAAVFSFTAFGIYNCTNNEGLFEGFPTENDYNNLQEVHEELTLADTLSFQIIDPYTDTSYTTPGGLVLNFPDQTDEGAATINAPLTVSVIEIYKRGDFVRHNVQTFANMEPLVSGGGFWIRIQDVTGAIIDYSGVTAIMPYKTSADEFLDAMNLYTGITQTTPSGMVNSWQTFGSYSLTFDPDAGVNGEFSFDVLVNQWNSAEAPYDTESTEMTQISVQIPEVTDFSNAEAFFISNDYTTIAALTSAEDGMLKSFPASIEKDITGKVVVIAIVAGKLKYGIQEVTVSGDDIFEVPVELGELSALNVLLTSIN